jgi:hypothetical protein
MSWQHVNCDFTSPVGRGRRAAPGEGPLFIDRAHSLTPTLSPRERGQTADAAALGINTGKGDL